MRAPFFAKIFYICSFTGVVLLLFVAHSSRKFESAAVKKIPDDELRKILQSAAKLVPNESAESQPESVELKYILQWTSPKNVPFVYMGEGQKGFIDRKCEFVNCFVTSDRNLLGDVRKFDVIAFSGPEAVRMQARSLPKLRSPDQKYVFTSIESSDYYPVCSNQLNGFFNWTWTFRLDSEEHWGYIIVRDKQNKVIGPKTEMHWIKKADMEPVSAEFKKSLKTKKKAAAWFVSNCFSRSRREDYVAKLQEALKKYDMTVDIYGTCGPLKCDRSKEDECNKMIETDYYFYLSFENSFSEDYVTEKLTTALKNRAVPIVYGAANYTRFMPDGIYLNAMKMNVQELAEKMVKLINDPDEYADYFKWTNHYTYFRTNEDPETDEYCSFCTILNDEVKVKAKSVYQDFRHWWNPPNRC